MTINEYIENRRVGLNERIEKFNELQRAPGKAIETWKQMTEVLTYTNETLQNILKHFKIQAASKEVLTPRSAKPAGIPTQKVPKGPKKIIVIPKKQCIH